MEHIQIAYDFLVIILGFAALSMAGYWLVRTGETDLRNFCLLYAFYTLILVISVVKKYLFLNVAGYSAGAWYSISGVYQILNFAVIVAAIYFLLGIYRIQSQRPQLVAFLIVMVLCDGLVFSPLGAVLDAQAGMIRFGPGYQIASIGYFMSFTYVLLIGYGFLGRVWNTNKKAFVIGLLIFATVGYGESLISVVNVLRNPAVRLANESDFLVSSIPYALYGVFLIVYFLRYFAPATIEIGELEDLLRKYGITDREREIILKVVQGKSNADIAGELFVSLATVKTHLHNIYRKMGVTSRYNLLARVRTGQE